MNRQGRIAHVDGLRAVAVLLVVAYHAVVDGPGFDPHAASSRIWLNGCHGVDLFFVLSGFCLSYPVLLRLYNDGQVKFDLARYAAHRLIRILPPYYAAVGFFAAFALVLGHLGVPLPKPMPQHGIDIQDIGRQMLFLDGGALRDFLNGSFWTLPIEFRWYFLMPAALLLWIRRPKTFAIAILALLLAQQTRANSYDIISLPAFLLGIVAADLQIRRVRWLRFAPAAFAIVFAFALLTSDGDWSRSPQILWQLAAFLLVVSAGEYATLGRVLSAKAFTAVGIASYSIYLVHEPLVAYFESHRVPVWAAGLMAVACGFVFWAAAERPFVATPLRDRIARELGFLSRWFKTAGIGPVLEIGGAPVEAGEQRESAHPERTLVNA